MWGLLWIVGIFGLIRAFWWYMDNFTPKALWDDIEGMGNVLAGREPDTVVLWRMEGVPIKRVRVRRRHICSQCESTIEKGEFCYSSRTGALRWKRWCIYCTGRANERAISPAP